MFGPRHEDPFVAELRKLADRLDRNQIKAVGEGLGIGSVKNRYENSPHLSPHTQTHFDQLHKDMPQALPNASIPNQDFLYVPYMPPVPTPVASPQVHAPFAPQVQVDNPYANIHSFPANLDPTLNDDQMLTPRLSRGRGRGRARWVLAHSVDLVIVTMSLAVALFCVGLLTAPSVGASRVAAIYAWMPVRLILQLHLFEFFALLYGLFVCYWLLCKLFIGRSVGALLFRATRAANMQEAA